MDFITDMLPDAATWRDIAMSAGLALAAIAVGALVHTIAFAILKRVSVRARNPWFETGVERSRKPGRLIFPLLIITFLVPALPLPEGARDILGHVASLLFIASIAYLLVTLVHLLRDFLLSRYDVSATDNLSARRVYTQVQVMEKVLLSVIAVATVAFMLMTFEGVRQVGVSILASAGIVGIILGLAAQKTIGTLFAGIQIAITQPIRLDDVVIVEGEWGWIEEISLTYVVVRIWDQRRLVLPITYFIETPFENWTRTSSDILGTVFMYVDYTVPVEAIRAELERLLETTELWDGRVAGVQVTDWQANVLEVRLLVSAADSGAAWDLRCLLREKMVEFVAREYPDSLPRVRAEFERLAPKD